MDTTDGTDDNDYWRLVAAARAQDRERVAQTAATLLAARPVAEILAAQQAFWDLMADSYTNPLWAAGYLVNGGCSDDGFDYFRGWLVAQGREVFERAVAAPDTLADHPAIRAAVAAGESVEDEEMLSVGWNAHIAATGAELPAGCFTVRHPPLDPAWDFDFDDRDAMARRLPRLAALCLG